MSEKNKFVNSSGLKDRVSTILILTCCLHFISYSHIIAQDVLPYDSATKNVTDVGDVFRKVFQKKGDYTRSKKKSGFAILPSLGYNPSFGFVIGAKASAIKQFGQKINTGLSAFGVEALYTSKGIITAQVRHNIFTAGNKFNLVGNWQASKFLIADYNIGTGNKDYQTDSDSTFITKYTYLRLTERVFRKIGRHLFAGLGVSINYRDNIDDENLETLQSTPHQRYSARNGFNPKRYSANALLFAIEYNSKEHPLRSYGGMFADFNIALSQKWLGSTKDAVQLIYELRRYISLSKRNHEHVLAFWHMASFKIGGEIPYLALQA
ncbi:MAG: hypothetical protein EOP48_17615 [Sphingobacteriales bacterium]|nr:MAG: hypothetical protein EOP48_17615 [Sphingobacteriales bacterium]